jgi:hypothetical protein
MGDPVTQNHGDNDPVTMVTLEIWVMEKTRVIDPMTQ